jgi:hypothetical protein
MSLPARQERELELIEGALEATEPRLASMFAMFNRLAKGERPVSAERVRSRAWRWGRRCWQPDALRRIAILLALAAVALSGLILGAKVRPVTRQCVTLPAGAPSAAALPTTAGPDAIEPAAARMARMGDGKGPETPGCPGYITNK